MEGNTPGTSPPNPRNLCTCKVVSAGNHKEVICLSPEVCKFCQPEAGTGSRPFTSEQGVGGGGRGVSQLCPQRGNQPRSPPYTQNTACPNRSLAGCPLRPDRAVSSRLLAHCLSQQVPEVPRTQLPQGKGFLHPLSLFFGQKLKCAHRTTFRGQKGYTVMPLQPCPQT